MNATDRRCINLLKLDTKRLIELLKASYGSLFAIERETGISRSSLCRIVNGERDSLSTDAWKSLLTLAIERRLV